MFLWIILYSNGNMEVAENFKGNSDSERDDLLQIEVHLEWSLEFLF